MITDKEIWDQENIYLSKVIKEIEVQVESGINAAGNYKKEAVELQKQMWEEVRCAPTGLSDLEDAAQLWQYQVNISNQARKFKFSSDKVSRLERMRQSPYFARIDFIEEGEEKEEHIYIGIFNLGTKNNREILVYDWRAPISGMFYDFETGSCSYACPAGLIMGRMLLKRQYKIEKANIVYMFDSSLSIRDEMLKDILGKSTDNRMKTIVASIQREQNTVIRNVDNRIMLVEGPAGSGKTSIALHRAAYLLYKYRESMKSENILVLSPNHVFEDYISNVLPELGEENVLRSTFADFFKSILQPGFHIEAANHQMEYILSRKEHSTRLKAIKFKASERFLGFLERYINYLKEGKSLRFEDLIYNGQTICSAEEITALFTEDYSRIPYAKRLEKLRQRLIFLLEQAEERRIYERLELIRQYKHGQEEGFSEEDSLARKEYQTAHNSIAQLTSFDLISLYKALFNKPDIFFDFNNIIDIIEKEAIKDICQYTKYQIDRNTIKYEDLAPILYLGISLDSLNSNKTIKHIIIDEAQDYTVIHYEIFRKAFQFANMTILGDMNQTVNRYMNAGSFESIAKVFESSDFKYVTLTKSYRSSMEIAAFCKQIISAPDSSEQLNRHGDKPKIIYTDKKYLADRISKDIGKLKSKGYKLIAVICKNVPECERLYREIQALVDIKLVSNKSDEYEEGVVIIPSYLSKGLEFDAVLVSSVNHADYSGEEERRILYTVCTRALHELYLYHSEDVSDLIKNISSENYSKE